MINNFQEIKSSFKKNYNTDKLNWGEIKQKASIKIISYMSVLLEKCKENNQVDYLNKIKYTFKFVLTSIQESLNRGSINIKKFNDIEESIRINLDKNLYNNLIGEVNNDIIDNSSFIPLLSKKESNIIFKNLKIIATHKNTDKKNPNSKTKWFGSNKFNSYTQTCNNFMKFADNNFSNFHLFFKNLKKLKVNGSDSAYIGAVKSYKTNLIKSLLKLDNSYISNGYGVYRFGLQYNFAQAKGKFDNNIPITGTIKCCDYKNSINKNSIYFYLHADGKYYFKRIIQDKDNNISIHLFQSNTFTEHLSIITSTIDNLEINDLDFCKHQIFTGIKAKELINANNFNDYFNDSLKGINKYFNNIDIFQKNILKKLYDEFNSIVNENKNEEQKIKFFENKFEKFKMIASLAEKRFQNQFKVKVCFKKNSSIIEKIKFKIGDIEVFSIPYFKVIKDLNNSEDNIEKLRSIDDILKKYTTTKNDRHEKDSNEDSFIFQSKYLVEAFSKVNKEYLYNNEFNLDAQYNFAQVKSKFHNNKHITGIIMCRDYEESVAKNNIQFYIHSDGKYYFKRIVKDKNNSINVHLFRTNSFTEYLSIITGTIDNLEQNDLDFSKHLIFTGIKAKELINIHNFNDYFNNSLAKIENYFNNVSIFQKNKLKKLFNELSYPLFKKDIHTQSEIFLKKFEKFIMIAALSDKNYQNQFNIKYSKKEIKFYIANIEVFSMPSFNGVESILKKYFESGSNYKIKNSLLELAFKVMEEEKNKNLIKLSAVNNSIWDLSDDKTKEELKKDIKRIEHAFDAIDKESIIESYTKFNKSKDIFNRDLLNIFACFQGIYSHQTFSNVEVEIKENGTSKKVTILPGNGDGISTLFQTSKKNSELKQRNIKIIDINDDVMSISTAFNIVQIFNKDTLLLETGLIFEDKFKIVIDEYDNNKINIVLIDSKMKLKL